MMILESEATGCDPQIVTNPSSGFFSNPDIDRLFEICAVSFIYKILFLKFCVYVRGLKLKLISGAYSKEKMLRGRSLIGKKAHARHKLQKGS